MSIRDDGYESSNDGILISVWDAVRHCKTTHFEEDREEDRRELLEGCGESEYAAIRRRGKYDSPETVIKKTYSHWCNHCKCAFKQDDIVKSRYVCPMCGNQVSEFNWNEIKSGENDWNEFRGRFIEEYGDRSISSFFGD